MKWWMCAVSWRVSVADVTSSIVDNVLWLCLLLSMTGAYCGHVL